MATKCMPEPFAERFGMLWKRCQKPGSNADCGVVYRDLARRYSEPRRYYHNWGHLQRCLGQLDSASFLMSHPEAVEMALWFHDAVYEPGAADNERRSAELFLRVAGPHVRSDLLGRIWRLILVTTHTDPPQDADERFIVDVDLSSFGLKWNEYLRDTLNIRRERRRVPDAEYYSIQMRFLRALLNRPRIFQTDFFKARHEQAARNNIQRLLTILESRGIR